MLTNSARSGRNTRRAVPVGPFRCLAMMISASAAIVRLGVVDLVAVDEGDDVGVLLEAPRLTQVGEHRALVLAVLELAVELRQRDHRALELAGEDLQPAGDLRHLDLAVLGARRPVLLGVISWM